MTNQIQFCRDIRHAWIQQDNSKTCVLAFKPTTLGLSDGYQTTMETVYTYISVSSIKNRDGSVFSAGHFFTHDLRALCAELLSLVRM